jgi:hypothetical protein
LKFGGAAPGGKKGSEEKRGHQRKKGVRTLFSVFLGGVALSLRRVALLLRMCATGFASADSRQPHLTLQQFAYPWPLALLDLLIRVDTLLAGQLDCHAHWGVTILHEATSNGALAKPVAHSLDSATQPPLDGSEAVEAT